MVMKESLVSQVDSTETLAPGAAGGERLGRAYRTGISGLVAIFSLTWHSAASRAVERSPNAAVCGRLREVQALFSPDDVGG
jgi:hypothetical protein